MTSPAPPLPAALPVPGETVAIGHSPAMVSEPGGPIPDIAAVESLLSDWFEAPTLLFSSGRAACHLFLEEMGLHRYRHTIAVPAFLSRCILNTLTLNAFPVRETQADAVLYHHQYGFRLRGAPREPIVLEDACHAFFSRPDSGARNWSGQAAVFSLPKFFSIAGPAGALVSSDLLLAERIRLRRDAADDIPNDLAAWRRAVIIDATNQGPASPVAHLLESAYGLLTEYPKPDPCTLAGFPQVRSGLAAVGEARQSRLEIFRECLGNRFPGQLLEHGLDDLPYALPYFGSGDPATLANIDQALSALGVHAGVYSLDIARSLYAPEFRRSVLLPCHHQIPAGCIKDICRVLKDLDA